MCPCVAWFARSRPGPGFVTSSSCGAAGFLLQTHPVSDRPPFRADLARSVRLFRAFRTEQAAPDAYYTALARDTVGQLGQYADLNGLVVADIGGGPGYF